MTDLLKIPTVAEMDDTPLNKVMCWELWHLPNQRGALYVLGLSKEGQMLPGGRVAERPVAFCWVESPLAGGDQRYAAQLDEMGTFVWTPEGRKRWTDGFNVPELIHIEDWKVIPLVELYSYKNVHGRT
jgi:hypothetical protein